MAKYLKGFYVSPKGNSEQHFTVTNTINIDDSNMQLIN